MYLKVIVDLPEKNKRRIHIFTITLFIIGGVFFLLGKQQNAAKACWAIAFVMHIFMRFLTTRTEICGLCAVSKTILRNKRFYLSEITDTQLFAGGSRMVVYGAGRRWLCEAMNTFSGYDKFVHIVKNKLTSYVQEPVPRHIACRGRIEGVLRIAVIAMAALAIVGMITEPKYKYYFVIGFGLSFLAKYFFEKIVLINDERNLKKYGKKTEVLLVGYIGEKKGTAYPVFEFKDKIGKHMVMGIRKVKRHEMKEGESTFILYLPEKVMGVCFFQ